MKHLLAEGVDPNAAEWSGRHGNHTALMYAAGCQFPEGVKMLLDAGADVHAQTVAGAGAAGGGTALHDAITGSDPTSTDSQGYSDPKQRLQVVELLLKAGANPFAAYDEHTTPLGKAASSGYREIVQIILERGTKLDNNPAGCDPPLLCAAGRHASVVELLLANGAKVDEESKDGSTALIAAAYRGAESIVDILLEHGANVNHRTSNGRTPLIAAAQFAQWAVTERQHGVALRIIKRLVESGADVTAKNNEGRSALDWALEASDPSVSEYVRQAIASKCGGTVSANPLEKKDGVQGVSRRPHRKGRPTKSSAIGRGRKFK